MEQISSDRFPPLSSKYPWLIAESIEEDEKHNTQDQIFCTIHNELPHYRCQIPELLGKRIRGYFHGWVILSNHPYNNLWSLWNQATSKIISLPTLVLEDGEYESIHQCCLSAPPEDPSSILLLTTTNKSIFLFCPIDSKREDFRWAEMSYAQQLKRLTSSGKLLHSLTCCSGKVYALNTDGTWDDFVIYIDIVAKYNEVVINLFLFTACPFDSNRPEGDNYYLKGSTTDLFYIEISFHEETENTENKPADVYLYKSDMTRVDWEECKSCFSNWDMTNELDMSIETWKKDYQNRLDVSREVWIEIDDLKDAIFYIDVARDHSVSYSPVVASELRGYIHIRGETGKTIYSYNVKDNTISLSSMPSPMLPTSHVSMWECRFSGAHSTATMNASLIRDTLDSVLDIAYILRRYQHFSKMEASTTMAPDEDTVQTLNNNLNILRQEEFSCMLDIVLAAEDKRMLWDRLRDSNLLFRAQFSSAIPENLSSKAQTIALSYPQDEDSKLTLSNMLNMLNWYMFDPTMKASTSQSAPIQEEDDKWRLKTEVMELFNKALDNSFHEFTEKWKMNWWCKKDGDFQCDNVLSIWSKIKKSNSTRYQKIKGPKDVGQRIKQGLVEKNLKSNMIEGAPSVHDAGFVNIKLSRNWMAENIHKMLRLGIDTWAPRQQLNFESTIVYSPSWNQSNLMPMDVLRRQLIIISRMHMLEYVKSSATTSSGNGMSLPSHVLDEHFSMVDKDGERLIYVKDDKNTKPLIRGKIRNGKSLGERDGCLGYPLEDLGALWHGFINEKADWIVCVTPTQQQDYIENCFNAAEHAGWTNDSFWPLATYIGFKTCSTSLEDLLSFLYKAHYPCEAGEAAKVLGYTHEAVLDCTITYAFLKCHRLADCKFNYNEMLDIKSDTFARLLTRLAQIRKITNHSAEDIDELKKASKLGFEEVIWSEHVERELGFHLLMFTELIKESYLSFFPHLLCRYLYELSEKFSHFYQTYEASGFKAKTRLLLCEASRVVMEKSFHLLGISQKPPLKAVSAAFALNYVAPSKVGNPVKNLNIRTRFEVFTTYLYISREENVKDVEVFGNIQVSDYYGLVPEGWGKLLNPGPGRVSLWNQDWRHSVEMRNHGRLKIGNPTSRHSVPFSSSMRIIILLYAATKNKDKKIDKFFEVCNHQSYLDFAPFLDKDSETSCEYLVAGGDDGHIRMHFILLRDAVDANIKVKLDGVSGRSICGKIFAYYDEFDYGEEDLAKSFYMAALFESLDSSGFENGDVPLTRSLLAVPSTGALVIEADFINPDSGDVILNDKCVFKANCKGSFNQTIMCNGCTLEVEITWSQD